ncbi:MAG: hypothetical protein HKL90_10460 [Elusimicrobia bacterium]|nr:hypothetical protein [Elusimicrobiota bacterium]
MKNVAKNFVAIDFETADQGRDSACAIGLVKAVNDKIARKAWAIRPTKLPDVCRHLGLKLSHHDALSDAEACANIVLAAAKDGTTREREKVLDGFGRPR